MCAVGGKWQHWPNKRLILDICCKLQGSSIFSVRRYRNDHGRHRFILSFACISSRRNVRTGSAEIQVCWQGVAIVVWRIIETLNPLNANFAQNRTTIRTQNRTRVDSPLSEETNNPGNLSSSSQPGLCLQVCVYCKKWISAQNIKVRRLSAKGPKGQGAKEPRGQGSKGPRRQGAKYLLS
jgi:hypothetical protein